MGSGRWTVGSNEESRDGRNRRAESGNESDRVQARRLPVLFLLARGVANPYSRSPCGRRGKFRLEPAIDIAQNYGLSKRRLGTVLRLIREHEDEIRAAWEAHFGG